MYNYIMTQNQLSFLTLTNEEKRVDRYQPTSHPTLPESVDANTNPETLNLNWTEKDLPERVRTKHVHRLHPYLGKFIPQLVEIFLRMYFKPGDLVYDPFCGSGTTLVEANARNIHSIGCDISAFNCLLAHVKTQRYNLAQAKADILEILQRVEQAFPNAWFGQAQTSDGDTTANSYLETWFAPQSRQELLLYAKLIQDYHHQDLLKIILSRSARSARLTTHFDLDFPKKPQTEPYYCYKHSRVCSPTQEALGFLRRYSLDTIKRIEEFASIQSTASVTILNDDSRKVQLPPLSGIITSPPYVGLIDYHEQHRYAYELLGLQDQSEREIGAAARGSSQSAKRTYREDISSVFRHAACSMAPGAPAIVVVHDKHSLYPEIANECGFRIESIVERHVNRRTGRRSGEFFEQIYVWRRE